MSHFVSETNDPKKIPELIDQLIANMVQFGPKSDMTVLEIPSRCLHQGYQIKLQIAPDLHQME